MKIKITQDIVEQLISEGYSKEQIEEVVKQQEKRKPILIEYIKDRIENKNKNFVMVFVGATGSGKSYSALRLAEELDETFDIDRVNFKAKDFMNTINQLVERSEKGEEIKGKVIMWDEFGVEHNAREFMTIANRVINYFFQTSRHLNLIVIMTVPLLSFIDSATRRLCHAVAEMQGINSSNKTASVKVKMVQTNVLTGNEYPKYLRYKKNHKVFVSKRIKFKLPSKKLLEDYEKKKKEFTTQLNKDIMGKLLRNEERSNKSNKALTDSQQRVAELLSKHNAEETANILGISVTSLYGHKTNIERKGYAVKPVWANKRIIHYDIEGLSLNLTEGEKNEQV